ncbi:MAG: hypothetical protein KAS71_04130, partial [Bacteroidales bacterium]|nr:hypothetical protein [Bacteroidales bacterium]
MQLTDSFYKQKFIIVYPNQFGYHTDSYKYCEYLNDRYDISYICFDQGFEKLELPHINVIYIQFNTGKIRRLIELFLEVFKNCNKNPDNILFVIQFKFSFLLGLFAKSKKKILDYRTGDLSINPLKRWLKNRWMSMDSLSYDKITVISDGVCKNIFLLNRKRIIILPLGADVISSKKHEYKQIRLLYVGAIHTRNVYQTIEGLAEFISMNKNLRSSINYTIIGFGPQHIITHLLETIKEKQVEDIVKYVGRVKYPDLTPYFDQCNVGISYI